MANSLPIWINFYGKQLYFPHVSCENTNLSNCQFELLLPVEYLEPNELTLEMEMLLNDPSSMCFHHWNIRINDVFKRQLSPAEIGPCDDLLHDEVMNGHPLPREEVKERINDICAEYFKETYLIICALKPQTP